MQWYYVLNGERVGPIDEKEFQSRVHEGTVHANTLVWNKTMTDWNKYDDVEKQRAIEKSISPQSSDIQKLSCSQCGKLFPQDDMIQFNNSWVCASCKPVFVQKLKEGLNVSGTFTYAGFWIRFGAAIIDGFIQMLLFLIVMIPAYLYFFSWIKKFPAKQPPDFSAMGPIFAFQGLFFLTNFSLKMAYETWFIGKFGATPGKMACHLKVINADGSSVSYWRAFGRFFGKFLSYIILYIGFIMIAFDKEKRGLHDHICETRVIKK